MNIFIGNLEADDSPIDKVCRLIMHCLPIASLYDQGLYLYRILYV